MTTQENNGFNSESRMMRGEKIAKEKTILENADGSFSVPSATVEEIAYLVRLIDGKYVCNCYDFKLRHVPACKHIFATKTWIATQVEIKQTPKPKVFADDSIQCPKCGSIRIVKYGMDAEKQVFKCKDCSHKFRELSLLKKAHYSPELVTLTLDLYFSGLSLRKITRMVSAQFKVDIHYSTIYAWIQKFIPMVSEYVNSLSPELSENWQADEVFVKMRNGVDYRKNKSVAFLWNVMDRKTRFLRASKLSPLRDTHGALDAFKVAQKNAHGNFPEQILCDSWGAYNSVPYMRTTGWNVKLKKNMGVNKGYDKTNNRIERLNGTCRERIKVSRGWKSFETQIAEGMRIHYNFVKPHEALEGMTPAQRAGLNVPNNWVALLEQAIKSSPENKQATLP